MRRHGRKHLALFRGTSGSSMPGCTRSSMFVTSPVPPQPADVPVTESQACMLEPKFEPAVSEVSGDMEVLEVGSSVSSKPS